MRRGIIRWAIAGLLVILGAAFPAAGFAFATQNAQASAARSEGSNTVDARDIDFLTKIKFANLWEIPMGKLATERGTTDAVKLAGQTMLNDHTRLETAVNGFAKKYGVQLPSKPSSLIQSWMGEITSKKGTDFDKTFATRIRAAHGTVFDQISEERSGTRNSDLRDFASQAVDIVMRHMTLLERTGYVDTADGMFAEAASRTTAFPENTLHKSDYLVAGLIFLVVGAVTVIGVRTLSAPRGAAK
jgi:putative membrane protein